MSEHSEPVSDDYGRSWSSQDEDDWGFVPDADGFYPPHRDACFGCGPDNETGLQIRVTDVAKGEIGCTYAFPVRFQGGPGVVHGGAIAAVLDDVVGTVPLAIKSPAVTARLTVNYRRPVLIGHEVNVRAWQENVDGRKRYIKGEMTDSMGRIVADADALMVEILPGHYERVAADLPPEEIPDHFKVFLPDENYP